MTVVYRLLPERVHQDTQSFRRRERHSFPAPSAKRRRRYKSRGVFPRGSCYESVKAIQSPHPGLKMNGQS